MFKVNDHVFYVDSILDFAVQQGTVINVKKKRNGIIEYTVQPDIKTDYTVIGREDEFFDCEKCAKLTSEIKRMKRDIKKFLIAWDNGK